MNKFIIAVLVGSLSFSCFANGEQTTQLNKITGAGTWAVSSHGVSFSLTQILPEQLQAFYVNRGFTLKQIAPFVSSCVYMAVLRNDNAPSTIHYKSNSWRVLYRGKPHSLTAVDTWLEKLTTKATKKSALIAFRWAQFPPEQEYEPGGDWNQGMLSIGLPPASFFDITAHWDIAGKGYEVKLKGVQCAK